MSRDLMVIGQSVKMELKRQSVSLPSNYSFENALKSAYLILQQTVDRNKRPALEVCTPESIHTSILDMSIQALNPVKGQCYFVVYGNKLQLMRSYMGSIAVAKRVCPTIKDIRAVCIYKNDNFEFEIENGQRVIKKHTQTFDSINSNEIIGVYAIAVDENEKTLYSDLMTIDQVKQSWKQSSMRGIVMESGNINRDTVHGKFSEEMVKKTIYHRICKKIIRTSDDSELLNASIRADEETPTEIRVQHEVNQNANRKVIDFKPEPEPEPEYKTIDETLIIDQPQNATLSHAKEIMSLEKHFNRDKEGTIRNISGFIMRDISRISELTIEEAEGYIQALKDEIEEVEMSYSHDDEPEWAKEA